MSYDAYLDNESKSGGQFATNSGMADFGRWVDSLDGHDELKHLRNYGWSQELDDLEADVRDAIETSERDDDVLDIVENLLRMIGADERADAQAIFVTDGCI